MNGGAPPGANPTGRTPEKDEWSGAATSTSTADPSARVVYDSPLFCAICRVRARQDRFNSEGLCQSCVLAEPLFVIAEGDHPNVQHQG